MFGHDAIRMLSLCGGLVVLACCAGAPGATGEPGSGPAPVLGMPQSEDESTGAVTTLTAADRGGQHANLMEELIQGRVPGLEVYTGRSGRRMIRIRGYAADMEGAPEPLLIVDGMPVQGAVLEAFRGLNLDLIDKIQVLKDVSSTAIFGTSASGGVILVTLRHD